MPRQSPVSTKRRLAEYSLETNDLRKSTTLKDHDVIHEAIDAEQDFLLWDRESEYFSCLYTALWAEPRCKVKLEMSTDGEKTWNDMEYLIFYQGDGVWFQSPAVAFQAPKKRGRSQLNVPEQKLTKEKSHERARAVVLPNRMEHEGMTETQVCDLNELD